MIKFFRRIRQRLLTENNFRKYFLYAIGEIFLVVIGILIALQINNNNEKRKLKTKEMVYLENIRTDLNLNIVSLEEIIITRGETVRSVDSLLEYFDGKELDLNKFNFYNIDVLNWYPFVQHTNTYDELLNSGNFALISNNSIKDELQNMEAKYETIDFIENEMQQDYERYLYEHHFNLVDLNSSLNNYSDQLNNEDSLEELDHTEVKNLMKMKVYKNGLVLAKFNSNMLIENYMQLIESAERTIKLIDEEKLK